MCTAVDIFFKMANVFVSYTDADVRSMLILMSMMKKSVTIQVDNDLSMALLMTLLLA